MTTKPFDEHAASGAQLREEADAIEDIIGGLHYARERGHLDSVERVEALKLVSGLKLRAQSLRGLAVLKERPAINKESA